MQKVIFSTFKSGAQKDTEGKLRMDLIHPAMEEALAEVLTYGCLKYDANNWYHGIPFSQHYSAIKRHLTEWYKGVDADHESGLNPLKHALSHLAMMIAQIEEERKDLDDRFFTNVAKKQNKQGEKGS